MCSMVSVYIDELLTLYSVMVAPALLGQRDTQELTPLDMVVPTPATLGEKLEPLVAFQARQTQVRLPVTGLLGLNT
jgi:hypothetical protein